MGPHPLKARILAGLEGTSRDYDELFTQALDVLRTPGRHGWDTWLLTALVMLPLTGTGALLNDATQVMLRRWSDEDWERIPRPLEPNE